MRRFLALFSLATLALCSVCLLYSQNSSSSPAVQDFDLEGIALFQCQCTAYACPCQKNGAPTHGTCEASDFVHIRTGLYGRVRLDGLNAAVIGNLVDKNSSRLYATIYVDEKASPAQRAALTVIEQFLNNSYETSSVQASIVKAVPIEFRESQDKTTYTVNIRGILEEKSVIHRDASGKPISTETAMDSWSNTEHYVDNVLFNYNDKEIQRSWQHSGSYANLKYFHLTKKMYDDKQMLGQFGDFSGHWTPQQVAIIKKQGLKEK